MSTLKSKIEAKDRTVADILDNEKYTIDYFQREYKWDREHIEQLIADLEANFSLSYRESHEREEIENYDSYFLGPIVISSKEGKRSIIDGQQRLTSLTLLLIYLNNLQKKIGKKVSIDNMIFSEKFGKKSFNIAVPERQQCFNALYNDEEYNTTDDDDDSVKNIVERYHDIQELFPEDLKGKALPYFIDWLKEKVTLVEINTYSDDSAYTIFETMNDRGLNLTPTEMLKGYLLSKIKDKSKRDEVNELWRKRITELNNYKEEKDLDSQFLKAWLRAKYTETIRPGKKGAANEDFEKIGTRFHTWVKDNLSKLPLNNSNDFYFFIKNVFDFYTKLYMKILDAQYKMTKGLEHLYYIAITGIAYSLSDPLLLASIKKTDNENIIDKKLMLMAKFIETFAVFRSVNYRTLSQNALRYTMYSLVKNIREKSLNELSKILKKQIRESNEDLSGISKFRLHQQNKRFVHFLLARITNYIEQKVGTSSSFIDYMNYGDNKPFQIEHLWADKFNRYKDEFDQRDDFDWHRNLIGGLVLIQKGTNQAFHDLPYEDKLNHYLRENLLVQSLNEQCYRKNPNFLRYLNESGLPFKPYKHFNKNDLLERQELYKKICEEIWNLDGFDEIANR